VLVFVVWGSGVGCRGAGGGVSVGAGGVVSGCGMGVKQRGVVSC